MTLNDDRGYPLTQTELEKELTPQYLFASQLIHLALLLGPLTFLSAVILVYAQSIPNLETDRSVVSYLSIVHALYAVVAYGAAWFLYGRQMGRLARGSDAIPGEAARMFLSRVRTAQIIRLALYEGVALFGLAVCLLASLNGILHVEPVYWWNALSTALLAGLIAWTFPSRERVLQVLADHYSIV